MDKKDKAMLPNESKILNIDFKDKVISSEDCYYDTPFYQTEFVDESDFSKFVKNVEKLIRKSDEYSRYIAYLHSQIGLNYCAILGNVGSQDDDIIEIHHGPILTLFDYCAIVTESYLKRKKKVNSFIIAERVLKLHFENKVQVVPLSETVHKAVHKGKVFIHPSQAFGDVNAFLEEYADGLTEENILIINEYIKESEKHLSTEDGSFELGSMQRWGKESDPVLTEEDLKIGRPEI